MRTSTAFFKIISAKQNQI